MLDVYNGSAFGVSECSQDNDDDSDVKEDEGFATPRNRNRDDGVISDERLRESHNMLA